MKSDKYELLDSGLGEKLERFGEYVLRRPDPEVIWPRALSDAIWRAADLSFTRTSSKSGSWKEKTKGAMSKEWEITHGGFQFLVRPTSFKHVGIFPEQVENWQFIEQALKGKSDTKVLNLFGYTGGSTLASAKAGAEVTHVDASQPVVDWAKKNIGLNNLQNTATHFITDDVMVYVRREVKRGKKYDGIIMDPPAFGHGPSGKLWKIEEHLLLLVESCFQILSDKPLFFIISGYASGYSPLAFKNLLAPLVTKFGGKIEVTELTIKESSPRGAILPAGVCARWSK